MIFLSEKLILKNIHLFCRNATYGEHMKFKTLVMDEIAVNKALTRISYEIIERSEELDNIILVGVKTRGVPISKILRDNIRRLANVEVPAFMLDVTSYRDDVKIRPESHDIGFDPTGKEVILVDDVLFTGRTTRACMDAVMESGRAKYIRLAVLMDRGHRELPIRADFVGKNVPTSTREKVVVKIRETDGETSVSLYENE